MTKIFLLFTCLLGALMTASGAESQDTLRHVQVLFRHGDRTPLHNTPNDRQPGFNWPFPAGILTNFGRTRAYRLGEFLKQRYSHFLEHVSRFDISARSSIVHRCLESTELVLAGMFPPKKEEVWSSDIPFAALWRPIPVETQPFDDDDVMTPKQCPALSYIMFKSYAEPVVQKFLKENMDLLKRVTTGAGLSNDIISLFRYYDVVMCEQSYFGANYTTPSWLSKEDYDKLYELYTKGQALLYRGHSADDVLRYHRVRVGPFLRFTLEKLQDSVKNINKGKKVAKVDVLGSHDTKIQDLMSALGFDFGFPLFSTTVAFELHVINNEPYLKVFYIEPEKAFKTTQLNFEQSQKLKAVCDGDGKCKLSEFEKALADIMVEDDCQERKSTTASQ